MQKIIGLTGKMGAGKDATAALLAMIGYTRLAFADQVRYEVFELLQGRTALDSALEPIRADLEACPAWDVWAKPTPERMRRILQFYGSEYRRAVDPDYWVSYAQARMPDGDVVISDVRFPNEVAMIRHMGGWIWRIDRQTEPCGIPGHVSEASVDLIKPDLIIDNSGTLIDLAARVSNAAKQYAFCAA